MTPEQQMQAKQLAYSMKQRGLIHSPEDECPMHTLGFRRGRFPGMWLAEGLVITLRRTPRTVVEAARAIRAALIEQAREHAIYRAQGDCKGGGPATGQA